MWTQNFCQTPAKVQTPVLGLGVDFVLPLSQQEEEEEQQQQEPHQNIPEGNILEVLNLAKNLTKPNQTHATPLLTLTKFWQDLKNYKQKFIS